MAEKEEARKEETGKKETRKEEINIDTNIGVSEMYEFTMNNNYKTIRGVVAVIFSICSGIGTIIYWNDISGWQKGLMIFFALMFTVIEPIEYYLRSKKQVKKNFKEQICYSFNEEGMDVYQGENSAHTEWLDIMKIISTKRLVVIYLSPVRAFILPKKDIGDKFDELKSMLESKTSCYKFSMK